MFRARTGPFACFLALSVSLMLLGSVRECASQGEDDAIVHSVADGDSSSPGEKESEGTIIEDDTAGVPAKDTSHSDEESDGANKDERIDDAIDATTESESIVGGEREVVVDSDSGVSEEKLDNEMPPDEEGMPEEKEAPKKDKKQILADKIQKAKILFADIDVNGDANVTREEILQWMERTKEKAIAEQLEADWSTFNTDGDDEVTWAEYKQGALQRAGLSLDDEGDQKMATDLLALEWGRFGAADRDKNDSLSKAEFKATVFPHLYPYMVDQMVEEMLKEVDNDSDQFVSLQEYRGMFGSLIGDQDPGMMQALEEQIQIFHKENDINGDGLLDIVELRPMVTQDTSAHPAEETDHLLSIADTDKNGDLDFDEFVAQYKDFKMTLRGMEYRPYMTDSEEEEDEEEEEEDEDDDDHDHHFSDDFNLEDGEDSDEGDHDDDDFFDFNTEEILKEMQKDEL